MNRRDREIGTEPGGKTGIRQRAWVHGNVRDGIVNEMSDRDGKP